MRKRGSAKRKAEKKEWSMHLYRINEKMMERDVANKTGENFFYEQTSKFLKIVL